LPHLKSGAARGTPVTIYINFYLLLLIVRHIFCTSSMHDAEDLNKETTSGAWVDCNRLVFNSKD